MNSVWSRKTFYDVTCRNWGTLQCICRYDLFSQIVRLKKNMSKKISLCFSGKFREYLTCEKGANTLEYGYLKTAAYNYIVVGDKNLIQKDCCAKLNIFIQWHVTYRRRRRQQQQHRIHVCVSTVQFVSTAPLCYFIRTFSIFFRIDLEKLRAAVLLETLTATQQQRYYYC